MSHAIVGFGKIGQALAHAFARRNINAYSIAKRMTSTANPRVPTQHLLYFPDIEVIIP